METLHGRLRDQADMISLNSQELPRALLPYRRACSPFLKAIGINNFPATALRGFFSLNVRRQAAARDYLKLFLDNSIDAILMPPAPHTAVPLDKWSTPAYTGIWNYLDYPAVVIPVDTVCEADVLDDLSNAKYGTEDARVYGLCKRTTPWSSLIW